MTRFIIDASALGKRYVPEAGAPALDYLLDDVGPLRLSCLTIGALETLSVIVRARNSGRIAEVSADQAISALALEVLFGGVHTIPAADELVFAAAELIEKHSINSTDAILLRAALDVQLEAQQQNDRVVLVSSDRRLLRAADRQGLVTFDPETEGIPAPQALAAT